MKTFQGILNYIFERSGDLQGYVDKVTLHAYKVTDKDMQQLKETGYTEDVILEVTLCAGVGASLARLECGLLALKGEA